MCIRRDNDIFIANGLLLLMETRLVHAVLTRSRYRHFLWPTWRVRLQCDSDLKKMNITRTDHGFYSSSLGVPIGNALLIGGLRTEVPRLAPSIPTEAVVRAGATDLESLSSSPYIIQGLREAYAIAISHVNIFLVVVICISVPTACGMEWLNIKKVSAQRETEKATRTVDVSKSVEESELQSQIKQESRRYGRTVDFRYRVLRQTAFCMGYRK